ncbi:MAG: anti-FecI sigma factor [Ignavibacteria bacterium]|nr:MAG: anti-FecI sigma factor [Ignavibacteria bacterium]
MLEGEAYFSVASNKEKPFSVKSGNVLTVVTGTEFDIKNRGERISVVVVKGSVNTFSPTKEEVFKLKKGDLLSFDNRVRMPKVQKANLRHYLAWRNDKFSFEHTRLSDVMDEIERYYNIKTSFQSDSLKNITMTGFFGSDSLNKILSVISLTLDIKLKYENRTIFINKN